MSKNTQERVTGVTIKELKDFLNKLPEEFNGFGLVNGEVGRVDNEVYYRMDKPIVYLAIDEKTKEFILLNQTQDEVNDIINNAVNEKDNSDNGNT